MSWATIRRAWAAGAGPGDRRLVVDVDSFVGETFGRSKQGAAFGYTRVRGYHPILATRADTGEVLHIRLRKGSANTSRGFGRFLDELLARVERAGATGPKLLRADSGVWNNHAFDRLDQAGWQFSIGARLQPAVRSAIEGIDEQAWQTLHDKDRYRPSDGRHPGRSLGRHAAGPRCDQTPDALPHGPFARAAARKRSRASPMAP